MFVLSLTFSSSFSNSSILLRRAGTVSPEDGGGIGGDEDDGLDRSASSDSSARTVGDDSPSPRLCLRPRPSGLGSMISSLLGVVLPSFVDAALLLGALFAATSNEALRGAAGLPPGPPPGPPSPPPLFRITTSDRHAAAAFCRISRCVGLTGPLLGLLVPPPPPPPPPPLPELLPLLLVLILGMEDGGDDHADLRDLGCCCGECCCGGDGGGDPCCCCRAWCGACGARRWGRVVQGGGTRDEWDESGGVRNSLWCD